MLHSRFRTFSRIVVFKEKFEKSNLYFILEPARGGMVGAAGHGKLSAEPGRDTRLVPSAPTRGLPIPHRCDAGQNPPDGCVSASSLQVFDHPKSKRRYRTLKIKSTGRMAWRISIFRKIVCGGFTNKIPAHASKRDERTPDTPFS